jgi:O-antigen/teichoic acid export membrane protein
LAQSNTQRIAKNTLMLYFRQILIMLVSLYTVRVVLEVLGAEDYGIYNVVAGVVVLFSFLNSAMSSATQRFLNYTLGQNNSEKARDVFSISFLIYFLLSILLIALAETIGLWFLNTRLNIPTERRFAAFMVYQISIGATVVNIVRIPYNAAIIAYEKMQFFALASIIEAVFKLVIVFLLKFSSGDSLIYYAFLIFFAGLIIFFIHKIYCNRAFEIARFRYCKDKKMFNQLVKFSGWSILGGFANVSNSQGTNMLLNIFFGITVNAAMGIATQVNTAVYQFVSNFQTAFNPQIVKSYAAKNYNDFITLVLQTSKISFYLLFLFALPLYINADFVLKIWLKDVPEYTIQFTRLILIFSLIDAVSGPLWMSIQATGDIKKYQLIVSGLIFANLPLSYLFLAVGFGAEWVLIIRVVMNAITTAWRIFFLQDRIGLPAVRYLIYVVVPITVISFFSGTIVTILHSQFFGWSGLVISCFASVVCTCVLIYYIGLRPDEKKKIKNWLVRKIKN